jgi:hypothetical protein
MGWSEVFWMYRLRTKGGKRDPVKHWGLPDRVFFACGACHVLAYSFLKAYPGSGFAPIWIRPIDGYTGNHIVVVRGQLAFDYHGYCDWAKLLAHMKQKATRWWPGWNATLVGLPEDVLISESKSRTYDGLWLREPKDFLFDPMPRAQRFLERFPTPPIASESPASVLQVSVRRIEGIADIQGFMAEPAVAPDGAGRRLFET